MVGSRNQIINDKKCGTWYIKVRDESNDSETSKRYVGRNDLNGLIKTVKGSKLVTVHIIEKRNSRKLGHTRDGSYCIGSYLETLRLRYSEARTLQRKQIDEQERNSEWISGIRNKENIDWLCRKEQKYYFNLSQEIEIVKGIRQTIEQKMNEANIMIGARHSNNRK